MLGLARFAAAILPASQPQEDRPSAETDTDPERHLAMLTPPSGLAGWITMVSGAFLISLCFLASFIAADAWLSRQPMSLQSICSNALELSRNRDEITTNEKWRHEFE